MWAGQFSIDPMILSTAQIRDMVGACKFFKISIVEYSEGPCMCRQCVYIYIYDPGVVRDAFILFQGG